MQPPGRSHSGSAIEPEGVRAETVDRPRLAGDAEKAAATSPPPSPPRPAREEKLTLRRRSHSPPSPRPTEREKQLKNGHHRQPQRRLLRAPSHCQQNHQAREEQGDCSPRRSTDAASERRRGRAQQPRTKTAGAPSSPRYPSRPEEGTKPDERGHRHLDLIGGVGLKDAGRRSRRRAQEPARGVDLRTLQCP
jgi:hypothetical protein